MYNITYLEPIDIISCTLADGGHAAGGKLSTATSKPFFSLTDGEDLSTNRVVAVEFWTGESAKTTILV